jgi:hypothetical protein
VWDGNYYALEVTTRLGLEGSGGMVRLGSVHYNTVEEIKRLGEDCRGVRELVRPEDPFQAYYQVWQVGLDDYPQDIEIHTIIAMDQPVSSCNHLKPG